MSEVNKSTGLERLRSLWNEMNDPPDEGDLIMKGGIIAIDEDNCVANICIIGIPDEEMAQTLLTVAQEAVSRVLMSEASPGAVMVEESPTGQQVVMMKE